MIPLSCREPIKFTDEDGVVFTFMPKSGANERECIAMFDAFDNMQPTERMDKSGEFVNKILLDWSDAQGRLPKCGGNPAAVLNLAERISIITLWHKANTLTVEEKKA